MDFSIGNYRILQELFPFNTLFCNQKSIKKVFLLLSHFRFCSPLGFLKSKNSSRCSSNSFDFGRKHSWTKSENSTKKEAKWEQIYFLLKNALEKSFLHLFPILYFEEGGVELLFFT